MWGSSDSVNHANCLLKTVVTQAGNGIESLLNTCKYFDSYIHFYLKKSVHSRRLHFVKCYENRVHWTLASSRFAILATTYKCAVVSVWTRELSGCLLILVDISYKYENHSYIILLRAMNKSIKLSKLCITEQNRLFNISMKAEIVKIAKLFEIKISVSVNGQFSHNYYSHVTILHFSMLGHIIQFDCTIKNSLCFSNCCALI